LKIYNYRDLWSGVMFLIAGIVFMILSGNYQIGTAAKMGPGYFPMVLGGLMATLGLIIILPALKKRAEVLHVEPFKYREIIIVLLGVAAFGLALPKLGFVIATFILVLISAYGSHEFKLKESLISAVVLAIGCYLAFVKGLELQFPVWPIFFK
jgi:Tripartite tricarboxylate transporter TctB family